MAKIYAPNKRYTGLIAGVSFVDGAGETDDKWLKNWFENKGYEVEEEATQKNENNTAEGVTSLEVLKVEELKEKAKELGIEGYSKMKKEELIAALAGE